VVYSGTRRDAKGRETTVTRETAPDGTFLHTADEVLASNLRRVRRRRFWDRRYTVYDPLGGHDDPAEPADDLEQEHVAARMRDLGHNWVQQTVSEVERGRRRVTATELVSLTLVLGASIGDLFDPFGREIAADSQARVRRNSKDLEALVCGHRRRAFVEWGGEQWTELVGVEFVDVEAEQ
jgi:transcriptional regulator with XRE-family HTH domain